MTGRILDFSESGAHLSLQYNQLVIRREGAGKPITTPVEELAALILSNPAITITQPLMAALAEAGAVLVVCAANHIPISILTPLQGHSTQAERMARQAAAPLPLRKRIWKTIVQSKIRSQARLLEELTGGDAGLRAIANRVRSGDPDNCEAHAARVYWPLLFANPDFRRNPEGEGANPFLNYGYAILRAITARALCATGLHPSLGVHHHNRYDACCLADDLMEPFRPIVDRAVAKGLPEWGPDTGMNRDIKRALLGALTAEVEIEGQSRSLFDLLRHASASLAAVLCEEAANMRLPAWEKTGVALRNRNDEDQPHEARSPKEEEP